MAEGNAITVKIGAETDGIERGLNEIQNSLKKIEKSGADSGESFGGSFSKMAGAVAVGQAAVNVFGSVVNGVFAAAQKVVEGFSAALDLGGTLSDLSASTGESAGNLLLLQRAFDNTGAGADKVGPALAKLQNNIFGAGEGSKEAVAAFGRMGLSMEDLAGKTPTQQLALVASGLTSIEDPSKRAATAIDVFGKSGAELLPLLTNFSGEMNEARATVGSMADIMDRRANVFDAVGDRFLIIQQKVRDFAAGILDKALPAIDAITSALSRIDAAAIGQKLADAFLGGEKAMKGFQAAVDAISIGKVGLAFELFWESLKLQAMQSGNAIYKYLSAGLQLAADTIVDLFGPSSGTFTLLIDSFAYAGKASGVKFAQGILAMLPDINDGLLKTINLAATFLPNIAGPAALAFNAANKGLDALRGSMDGMQANLEKQKETLGTSFENFSANAKKQIGEIPKEFEQNLASANAEFFKTGEQAAVVKTLQDEVTAATAATTAERATQAAQTEDEFKKRQALKDQQAAADAQAKSDKTAIIELETQLNAAKAAGNTELATALEKRLEDKKALEEIKKLTEEYQKTLGVNANEAARLANNFVNARNAANDIANRNVIVTVTTKVNREEYDNLMASINAGTKDPKTLEVLFKTTGKTDFDEAYKTLQNMQAINKNFNVALNVSGADSLEEVWQNLNSIPTTKQIQLGMEITGKDTYDEVIRSLPQFAGTKTAKLLLEQQGFENMTSFINTLKGIPDEKRVKLIAEALGTADVNAAKAALDQVLANDGKKATVSVGADTSEAEQKIQSVKQSTELPLQFQTMADITSAMSEIDRVKQTALQPLTLNLEGDASDVSSKVQAFEAEPIQFSLEADDTSAAQKIDALGATPLTLSLQSDTAAIQNQIDSLTSAPQTLNLDASASIEAIKSKLKENIDLSVSAGEGSKILGEIKGFVETIKGLVEKIEPKLPTHALA